MKQKAYEDADGLSVLLILKMEAVAFRFSARGAT